ERDDVEQLIRRARERPSPRGRDHHRAVGGDRQPREHARRAHVGILRRARVDIKTLRTNSVHDGARLGQGDLTVRGTMPGMPHRVRSIVCIAFVVLIGAAGRLEAQTCNGYGSIHTGPWQLSVGGLWNDASDRFLAYLQHAWGNAIAGGGYSVTSVDKID